MQRRLTPPPPKSEGQLIYEMQAAESTSNTPWPEWRDLSPDEQQQWEMAWSRLKARLAADRAEEGDREEEVI